MTYRRRLIARRLLIHQKQTWSASVSDGGFVPVMLLGAKRSVLLTVADAAAHLSADTFSVYSRHHSWKRVGEGRVMRDRRMARRLVAIVAAGMVCGIALARAAQAQGAPLHCRGWKTTDVAH
jgi:hypothetical protein